MNRQGTIARATSKQQHRQQHRQQRRRRRRRWWRMCVDLSYEKSKPATIIKRHIIFVIYTRSQWIELCFGSGTYFTQCAFVCFSSSSFLFLRQDMLGRAVFPYIYFFLSPSLSLVRCHICRFDIPHWSFSSYVLLTWHKYHWMHTCATRSRIDWEAQRKLLTWNPIQRKSNSNNNNNDTNNGKIRKKNKSYGTSDFIGTSRTHIFINHHQTNRSVSFILWINWHAYFSFIPFLFIASFVRFTHFYDGWLSISVHSLARSLTWSLVRSISACKLI